MGSVVNATPLPFTSGNNPVPLYRRLGRSQGRSARLRKMSLLPAFDPQTMHPVVSCYTDYGISANVKTWLLVGFVVSRPLETRHSLKPDLAVKSP
jgi:hypothetical protein